MKTRYRKFIMLIPVCLMACSIKLYAQMSLVPFVNNVTAVTDIGNCGDNRVFIVEQAGKIRIADLQGVLYPVPFLSITGRVLDGGERGLLGLAFSPDYLNDGRFYVNYTNNTGNSVISRFLVSTTNPDVADSLNEEILLTVNQPYSNHNGGAMFFGKDGYLYISLGDGGSAGDPGNRAQNPQELLGKLLRIDVNVPAGFSIPDDNPFYNNSGAGNPLIWSLGLRNAWRVTPDKLNGDVWIADVGQNLWEEIHHQQASSTGGENYGWRCYEGNVPYNTAGCQPQSAYVSPIYVFAHGPACSVTGGYVYRGAEYSSWFGRYFFTDYCDGLIRSLLPTSGGNYLYNTYGTFQTFVYSTFGQDRYGELYIGKNSTGVMKLTDAGCSPVAFISPLDTISHCGMDYTFTTPAGQGFLYQWFLNGVAIANATSNSYTANQNGNYHVQVVNTSFCSSNSDTVFLELTPAPAVTIGGVPGYTCLNYGPVTLTGNPAGGTFSGMGITGNSFDPGQAGLGTHKITYTYNAGNGCIISASANSAVALCTSTNEVNEEWAVNLWPNPARHEVELTWPVRFTGNILTSIMGSDGRVHKVYNIPAEKGSTKIDLNGLDAGWYLLQLQGPVKTKVKKLQIVR
jgi:glucose/arabinose dehydrogenase